MNLANFWSQQITKWNEQTKCGFCWEFSAPLVESSVNLVETTEDTTCCVKVMLLQDKQPAFTTANSYSSQTGFLNNQICANNFQLLVLLDSKLGVNNYNEIKGHSINESKWETIYNRLQECLQCDANLAFCEILGASYRITTWSGSQVFNYLGSNYCGYRINVTFQKNN